MPTPISIHANPSKPGFVVPDDAVDAHCHVFGPGEEFPFAPERRYTPCDASKEQLFALRDHLGFSRNIIVQATCHGADNRAMVDALRAADARARGVATVRPGISEVELADLHEAGVRGVRFNFVKRLVDTPSPEELSEVVARIKPLGWHVVIYFEAPDLPDLRDFLTSIPLPLVVDHMGRPDVTGSPDGPGFAGFLDFMRAKPDVWCKVTCPERLSRTGPAALDGPTLEEILAMDDVDAVILATPTPMHADQTQAVLSAGKHVQVEIPLADSLAGAQVCAELQEETGLVAMVGHTRRFNPSHQWVRRRVMDGSFTIQQMDVQTYFFRRQNLNALGQPRSWTDHLLWHHAAHTVDLFAYQTSSRIVQANAIQGPIHPELGIAMDLSIQLRAETGAICTLSLSFNNDGPFGAFFRYIGDTGTYLARYDDLTTGQDEPIDVSHVAVSMDGIELQDREFVAAIRDGRQPNSSIADVLPCYRTLDELERQLRAAS